MPIDIGSISALTGSLQSAVQIAKALASLRDGALIQEKVIELQQAILAAQSSALAAQTEQFALQARATELEEQISRMRDWRSEKKRYKLAQISEGAFAYIPNADGHGSEPAYWLCTNCFENGIKSFLQNQGRSKDQGPITATYKCSRCSEMLKVPFGLYPSMK